MSNKKGKWWFSLVPRLSALNEPKAWDKASTGGSSVYLEICFGAETGKARGGGGGGEECVKAGRGCPLAGLPLGGRVLSKVPYVTLPVIWTGAKINLPWSGPSAGVFVEVSLLSSSQSAHVSLVQVVHVLVRL